MKGISYLKRKIFLRKLARDELELVSVDDMQTSFFKLQGTRKRAEVKAY